MSVLLSQPSDNQQGTFLGAQEKSSLPVFLSAYLRNMILPACLNAVLFCSPPNGTQQDMEKGALVRKKDTPPQERKHVACLNKSSQTIFYPSLIVYLMIPNLIWNPL